MEISDIRKELKTEKYSFLKNNEHLGKNVILLGLGGSHAYGTSNENSDIDVRGIAVNSKNEILTNQKFEVFTNEETDTTIYSFNKIVSLLANSNPNTIELLGLKPEHYLYVSDIGKELLENKKMFLSKRAIQSFGGYANSQLRRLDNKVVRDLSQAEQETHILNSIKNAEYTFRDKYFGYESDAIKLYTDKAIDSDLDTEVFMDVNLTHYPLRDYKSMWSEMNNIVKDYSKIGKRNKNAIEHQKLGKHAMHLVRLYFMCIDILEKQEIVTYREKEHDLLMDIRNGKYFDSNGKPISGFYDLLNELEKKFEYAKMHTELPDSPNYKKINEFMAYVNELVVVGKV